MRTQAGAPSLARDLDRGPGCKKLLDVAELQAPRPWMVTASTGARPRWKTTRSRCSTGGSSEGQNRRGRSPGGSRPLIRNKRWVQCGNSE